MVVIELRVLLVKGFDGPLQCGVKLLSDSGPLEAAIRIIIFIL